MRSPQALRRFLADDFIRHSALLFASTMFVNVLNYAFNFTLSRKLGVEHYAELTALVGGLMIASIPSAAINLIGVKYGAEYHALGDVGRLMRLSRRMLLITSGIALAVVAIGVPLRHAIAAYLHVPADGRIVVTLVVVAFSIVLPSVRGILQGCQDFRRFAVSTILEALLKVALAVAFVFAGWGVVGAMSGWALATCLSLIYTAVAVRVHFDDNVPVSRLSLDLRSLAGTIGYVSIATACLTFLGFMDVVLVKHYFSARDAGLYSAVNLTGKIVLFLVGFFPAVLLPKAVAKVRHGENATSLLTRSIVATLLISGAIIGVFALAPHLVLSTIAGGAYAPAAPYLLQYDAAMALLAVLTLVINFRIALHRFDFLIPLVVVLIAEVAAISFFHSTIWNIIHVLLAGNLAAIGAACYRLNRSSPVAVKLEAAA